MQKEHFSRWIEIRDRKLSAGCLVALLRTGRPVRLISCHVTGDPGKYGDWVHLESFTVREALHGEGCTFHTRFEAKDARFNKTLTLRKCHFERGLTLRGAEIGGT